MLEQMKKTIQSHHMLPEGSSVLVGVSGLALHRTPSRPAASLPLTGGKWRQKHANHGLRGQK